MSENPFNPNLYKTDSELLQIIAESEISASLSSPIAIYKMFLSIFFPKIPKKPFCLLIPILWIGGFPQVYFYSPPAI